MSLLTALRERFSNSEYASNKSKIAKRVIGLILVAGMTVAPLTMSSCNVKPTDTQTPGVTDPNNTDNPDKPTTEYSQILQTVLTSSHYNNMIDKSMKDSSAIFFSNPNFAPIPYGFLQQNGHNISAIRERQLQCNTEMYFINEDTNNLYMSVHVENNTSTITDYVLKYNITNKEYNELKMLFKKDYIQAPLFIQELSNQKTASVQSEIKLTKNAYNIAKEYVNDKFFKDLLNCESINFDITYLSEDSKKTKINLRSTAHNKNTLCEIRTLEGVLKNSCYVTVNNNVYDYDKVIFKSSNNEELNKPGQTLQYLGLESGYTTNNFKNINK